VHRLRANFRCEARPRSSELTPNKTEWEGGNGQTNFRSNRALEVNPHPWAKRVLDPSLGRALGLGIASRSDCRVSNVDRDAQTRHFEGSLGLATPRGELVSARADLGKP